MAGQTADKHIEALAAAITAQNRTLALVLSNQKLHNEMLAKVLEAVTKEGDSELGEGFLAKLVSDSAEHTEKLDLIIERVYLE